MTTTALPQHLQALTAANDTRLFRAHLKRDLKAGRVEIAPVVLDPDTRLGSMRTTDLLGALPRVGTHRAGRLVRAVGISETRTIGALTPRQRGVLVAELERAGLA